MTEYDDDDDDNDSYRQGSYARSHLGIDAYVPPEKACLSVKGFVAMSLGDMVGSVLVGMANSICNRTSGPHYKTGLDRENPCIKSMPC